MEQQQQTGFVCMMNQFGECYERHASCIGPKMCHLKDYQTPCHLCAFTGREDEGKCEGCYYEHLKKE